MVGSGPKVWWVRIGDTSSSRPAGPIGRRRPRARRRAVPADVPQHGPFSRARSAHARPAASGSDRDLRHARGAGSRADRIGIGAGSRRLRVSFLSGARRPGHTRAANRGAARLLEGLAQRPLGHGEVPHRHRLRPNRQPAPSRRRILVRHQAEGREHRHRRLFRGRGNLGSRLPLRHEFRRGMEDANSFHLRQQPLCDLGALREADGRRDHRPEGSGLRFRGDPGRRYGRRCHVSGHTGGRGPCAQRGWSDPHRGDDLSLRPPRNRRRSHPLSLP